MRFTLLLLTILALSGCAKMVNKEKIDKVDSLIVIVNDADTALGEINMENVNQIWSTSSSDLSYLKWASDYTTRKDQFLADAYNANAKMVKKLQTGYKRTGTEIEYSKTQLHNLKADLESSRMADSLFNNYFTAEERAAIMVKNSVSKLAEWEETTHRKYQSLKPRIDSLHAELEKKGIR